MFEVTQADTLRIHLGDRQFVDAALRALRVPFTASTWQVVAGRCFYYTDDPDRTDWRDRWPRMWRVCVTPSAPPPSCSNRLFRGPIDQQLSDSTWKNTPEEEDQYQHTAFVIVDFRHPRDAIDRITRSVLAGSELRARLSSPEIRALVGDVHQLHLVARDLDLPVDIAALDALVSGFKTAGGIVNWRWRLAWSAG